MGIIKTTLFRVLEDNRDSILDMSVLTIHQSGTGARMPMPKFLAKKLARRIVIDDGDEILVVVIVEKDKPIVYKPGIVRHTRKMPDLEDIESPVRAKYWMEKMCIEYLRKRGYTVREKNEE